jgi:type VI secretion system protein ImpE
VGAEESLRDGRVVEAIDQVQAQVRDDPANPTLRIFLFQLLAVAAQWNRAGTQLSVLRDMDAAALPMVHAYSEALRCELLRQEIFAGKRSPLIFGDPEPWVARMVEALRIDAEGKADVAASMRSEALEGAEPSTGQLDGAAFEWIADADPRLGPQIELVANGKYYWVPFARIRRIHFDAPTDLRDLVWQPAQITWANGGEAVALLPTRYPGVTKDDPPEIQLARRTEWSEPAPEVYHGAGQRIWATDVDEYPLLNVREVLLDNEEPAPESDDEASPAESEGG